MGIKNEILLIIIIVVLIIFIEIITAKYTSKVVNLISYDAEKVLEELYNKSVQDSIIKLKQDWMQKEDILSCYIEHDELEKVTSNLVLLEENAKNEEYEQALLNVREFIYWLNHFKEKDELFLKNIL